MSLEPVNRDKISNLCAGIITTSVGIDTKIVSESDALRYSTTPSSYSIYVATTDHDRRVKVIPLGNEFWLNFSIEFTSELLSTKKYTYYLSGVTLMVFKGIASDERKELLFRGEWDNNPDADSKHPQPHWHIHFAKREMSEKVKKNFNDIMALIENDLEEKGGFLEAIDRDKAQSTKEFNLSKFHFAMSARWHTEDGTCKYPLNAGNLLTWLRGCLEHVRYQIEYCSQ